MLVLLFPAPQANPPNPLPGGLGTLARPIFRSETYWLQSAGRRSRFLRFSLPHLFLQSFHAGKSSGPSSKFSQSIIALLFDNLNFDLRPRSSSIPSDSRRTVNLRYLLRPTLLHRSLHSYSRARLVCNPRGPGLWHRRTVGY